MARFDPGKFGTMMQNGGPRAGFIFIYRFDAEHAYDVYFDAQGNVTSVVQPPTAVDLFNGNL